MNNAFVADQIFEKKDYTEKPLAVADYDACTFINCNFSGSDLSNINFSECEFQGCNLSMSKLAKTGIKDVKFTNCKLLGLHFQDCSDFLFAATFEDCILNLSSFCNRKMKKTIFRNCTMHETEFAETDLTNAVFDNCDLANASFLHSILEKADFRTSYNYSIDPERNKMKKAKFSKENVAGLLDKYDIEVE